ncbi:MAG: radical SAM protein [Elusimicrobiota bacterium]|nr:radical SAM protein [Elusimicrobiota bacterium]
MKNKFKYIFGPVPSWRLGSSLGVDPISGGKKICSFDCIYCQVGKTLKVSSRRKVFIKKSAILKELKALPKAKIDYITFSGMGEPTLAKNLGEMIKAIKRIRKEKIAVLTNSSVLKRKDVRDDLMNADFVVAKLDASNQKVFEKIDRPVKNLKLKTIIAAIKNFKKIFKGKLALQIMFTPENKKYAGQIARIAKDINPDETQLNTPLRPCGAKPVSKKELNDIAKHFKGLNIVSVYEAERIKTKSFSDEETLRRRGKI